MMSRIAELVNPQPAPASSPLRRIDAAQQRRASYSDSVLLRNAASASTRLPHCRKCKFRVH